jgi:hypothetical protein
MGAYRCVPKAVQRRSIPLRQESRAAGAKANQAKAICFKFSNSGVTTHSADD